MDRHRQNLALEFIFWGVYSWFCLLFHVTSVAQTSPSTRLLESSTTPRPPSPDDDHDGHQPLRDILDDSSTTAMLTTTTMLGTPHRTLYTRSSRLPPFVNAEKHPLLLHPFHLKYSRPQNLNVILETPRGFASLLPQIDLLCRPLLKAGLRTDLHSSQHRLSFLALRFPEAFDHGTSASAGRCRTNESGNFFSNRNPHPHRAGVTRINTAARPPAAGFHDVT